MYVLVMESGAVTTGAVTEVSTQVMRLTPLAVTDFTDQELVDSVADMVTARAVIDGFITRAAGEIDRRELSRKFGASSTAAWLSNSGHLDRGHANRTVAVAHALTSLPLLAAALQVGDITAEHAHSAVTAITAIDDACPELDPSARTAAEQILLDVALAGPPSKVAARGQELLLALSTPEVDGCAAEDMTRNQLTVTRNRSGRHIVRGDFDIETAEKLHSALSGLSAPLPAEDGTPDDRSPARRRADGFADLLDAYLGSGAGPAEGGVKPHLTLTASVRELADGGHCQGCTCAPATAEQVAAGAKMDRAGRVALAWLGPFSTVSARLLACDCDITAITLDDSDVPVNLGRTERVVPAKPRRAVVARDEGCAMPGCGRPAAWCVAHHIEHWIDGGATDLANLVLLCGHHHRVIHHGEWVVYIGDDGHPWFIPPATVDPFRQPIPAHNRAGPGRAAA